jgi:undecaprenyl-diphosphatase
VAIISPSAPERARRAVARIDEAIERRARASEHPALDRVVYRLSSAADHSLLWHAAGALQAMRTGNPAYAARFSAAMGIESLVTNVAIKSVFGRLRPHRPPDVPLLYGLRRPVTSSFPSGHATAAFCAASLLARGSPAAPAWYLLATAVAATRVYVRLHHASDIVAGAALGLALGHALRPLMPPTSQEHR